MSESLITKKAIAQGIKELMKKNSLDKITISDITAICGLNRQTFYYHFQDKYELVNWIYYNEAISIITGDLSLENWGERVFKLLTVMKDESYFYQNALRDTNNNEFQNYLFSVTKEIFIDLIEHVPHKEESDSQDETFVAEFLSYGVVGMIVAWAKNGMKQSPEEITKHLRSILYEGKSIVAARYLKEIGE